MFEKIITGNILNQEKGKATQVQEAQRVPIKMNPKGSSGQDGVICRNTSLSHTTSRRITTNLKTVNNQKCQKIKLHGTLTTKELKKHSSRPVEDTETGSWVGREDPRQGSRPCGQGEAGLPGN